jgi:hypothetical protein
LIFCFSLEVTCLLGLICYPAKFIWATVGSVLGLLFA